MPLYEERQSVPLGWSIAFALVLCACAMRLAVLIRFREQPGVAPAIAAAVGLWAVWQLACRQWMNIRVVPGSLLLTWGPVRIGRKRLDLAELEHVYAGPFREFAKEPQYAELARKLKRPPRLYAVESTDSGVWLVWANRHAFINSRHSGLLLEAIRAARGEET